MVANSNGTLFYYMLLIMHAATTFVFQYHAITFVFFPLTYMWETT